MPVAEKFRRGAGKKENAFSRVASNTAQKERLRVPERVSTFFGTPVVGEGARKRSADLPQGG